MSDDYTPTTEEVEAHWADVGFAGDRASFRRWLAEHDRRVAAAAWEDGWAKGALSEKTSFGRTVSYAPKRNPYKQAPHE